MFKLVMATICIVLPGCGSPTARAIPGSGPGQITVRGDWDDLEAAVLVGASVAEMAVLGYEQPGPGEFLVRLRTVRDEPAVFRAVRQIGNGEEGPGPIELSAEVGRFGDRRAAAELVRAIAERLEDLAGVDYRPLD